MSRAVIFTHIAVSEAEAVATAAAAGARRLMERTKPYFKAYLQCRNIGLVYVYVDVGTRVLLHNLRELDFAAGNVNFSLASLEAEVRTRNCLKMAKDQALSELLNDPDLSFDKRSVPRFQFVGLPHLLSLFNALFRIDPKLVEDLAGEQGQLTYDSPKFVEAVIRLVRAANPNHARYPIFRIDEDVLVNEEGIGELLKAADHAMDTLFFRCDFFSGHYGRSDGVPEAVNDFAVRVHWLTDDGTLNGKSGHFLRDLGEFGATQVRGDEPPSDAMEAFIRKRRGAKSANREVGQVISGAGLYMSQSAIRKLPPFMNFNNATTWVDDHLKRRLHEALGHLTPESLERVTNARFRQSRHPKGVTADDRAWASRVYFARLLRGCLVHATIVRPDGAPGPLSLAIKEMLDLQRRKPPDKPTFEKSLGRVVSSTATEILQLWAAADYEDTMLSEWAAARLKSGFARLCTQTVHDILAYTRLVGRWNRYVEAIESLLPVQAHWLFRRVDELSA